MMRLVKFLLFCGFVCFCVAKVYSDVTPLQYERMPALFHLDNFDACMVLGKFALYCSVTFQLTPKSNNSEIWRIIKEVISNPRNYRHDRLRHGVCIPTTCPGIPSNVTDPYNSTTTTITVPGNTTRWELSDFITQCYRQKYSDMDLSGYVKELRCETAQTPYNIDGLDICFGVFCILLMIIVIAASFYEGMYRYKPKEDYEAILKCKVRRIIVCFSIPHNWSRLRKKNTTEDGIKLRCIQGIRFFNMICVIMAHTVMITFTSPVYNPKYNEESTQKPLNMFFVNGGYAVQTFFLISGWLLSLHFFQTFEQRKDIDLKYIILAFVNRYLRLTPVLLIVIGFCATWLPHLARGPLWDSLVGQEYRNCRENWWTNILYINNYYESTHMCLQQSWYVAADTQLFVASLIVLIILWKFQKHAIQILIGCIFLGIAIPFAENYINDFDIVVRSYPEVVYRFYLTWRHWHVMYSHGHNNLAGYMQGLLFGYIYYKYRRTEVFKNKLTIILWWIITWTLPLSMILIASVFYQDGYEYTRLGAAFYQAIGKYLFCLGIGLGIFGITQGQGWFKKWFTEWHPVTILGRLTYCVYLIHTVLIRARGGSLRTPVYVSDYLTCINTLGDVVISYLCATLLCLFVELPISSLQKLMLPQLSEERVLAIHSKSSSIKNGDNGKEYISHKF